MTRKKNNFPWPALALSATVAATLVACGGNTNAPAAASPVTLSGVAATGAAFTGAVITVTDKTGAVVGTSSAVGADGTFSITLSATAQAPFVLSATRTDADGSTESLVSVVADSGSTASTVNISPVTTLIASRLSPTGDPAKLAGELASGSATITTSTVTTSVDEVKAILAPLLTATGTTDANPLTATFATDGTGYDRLLDSLKVTIVPASATTSNIEVAVKQQLATDDAAPTAITFTSATTTPPALPTIDANTLVPSGTAAKISDFLTRLNACYALPGSTRVNSTFTSGLATGTAANVVASACTSLFHTNVATFKNNGTTVGRDANGAGAFSGLFKDAATGVIFSQGTYEFSRANGDIVAGYKSRDTAGNEQFDTFVLKADATDGGKLKLIGNQYQYGGGVVAYQQLREFVSQASSNYYSSGYDLRVPLITNVTFVNVTTPRGTTISLIPGADGMVLPSRADPSKPSGTSFVRLASTYQSSTGAPTLHPRDIEGGLFFVPTDSTDTQLSEIPNQAVWTFKYYSGVPTMSGVTATGGTLLATQYFKTRTRANTIAELRTQKWANLSDASIADMVSRYVANTGTTTSYASLPASSAMSVTWDVPSGALPPTQVKLFGNALYFDYASTPPAFKTGGSAFNSTSGNAPYSNGRTPFNDGQTVGSTARSSTISCANGAIDSNQMGEKHCAVSGAGYLASARQVGLHLWARDPSGREYAHFYVPYTLQ